MGGGFRARLTSAELKRLRVPTNASIGNTSI
jgi:hypothetical protein